MTSLTPHVFEGTSLRTYLCADGEVEFVATDVATILGYRMASDMTRSLEADEKGTRSVSTPGGEQLMTTINEAGFYRAVMNRSAARMIDADAKATVQRFQRWVTHEVLPSIRKTGGYRVESITKRELALMVVEAEDARELAEQRARELEPAARAWSTMVACSGDYAVDEAAKVLSRDPAISTGRNRLFETMREQGWIYRSGHRQQWHAYQSQIECGRLAQKMASGPFLNHRTGELELPAPTIRITAKGLSALHRILGGTADLDSLLDSEVAA